MGYAILKNVLFISCIESQDLISIVGSTNIHKYAKNKNLTEEHMNKQKRFTAIMLILLLILSIVEPGKANAKTTSPTLPKNVLIYQGASKIITIKKNGCTINRVSWKQSNTFLSIRILNKTHYKVNAIKSGTTRLTATIVYKRAKQKYTKKMTCKVFIPKKSATVFTPAITAQVNATPFPTMAAASHSPMPLSTTEASETQAPTPKVTFPTNTGIANTLDECEAPTDNSVTTTKPTTPPADTSVTITESPAATIDTSVVTTKPTTPPADASVATTEPTTLPADTSVATTEPTIPPTDQSASTTKEPTSTPVSTETVTTETPNKPTATEVPTTSPGVSSATIAPSPDHQPTGGTPAPTETPAAEGNPDVVLAEYEYEDASRTTIVSCTNKETATKAVIPSSVTTIANEAFVSCEELTTVVIPYGIISIGSHAFMNCSSLTTIYLPNSVREIGPFAFFNCISLEQITFPDSMTTISSGLFVNCCKLKDVSIPKSITTIDADAFAACKSIEEIYLPNSITTINDEAFQSCPKLKRMILPDSVTYIGNKIFQDCKNLTTVVFSNQLKPSKRVANSFEGCDNIINITWKGNVYTNVNPFQAAIYLDEDFEPEYYHPATAT